MTDGCARADGVELYAPADVRDAKQLLHRQSAAFAGILLAFAAAYVFAALRGNAGMMYAALVCGFAAAMLWGDLAWLPAWRYARFIREMLRGSRRACVCVVETIATEAQMQDGARVRAMQVRVENVNDSRVFYWNVSAKDRFPPVGARICLCSYGRHALSWKRV